MILSHKKIIKAWYKKKSLWYRKCNSYPRWITGINWKIKSWNRTSQL